MSDEPWEDDVMKMANYMHNGLSFIMKERSQLYGTIIYLMISNNINRIELPPPETFNTYGRDYYILFNIKDGLATVEMKERPENE